MAISRTALGHAETALLASSTVTVIYGIGAAAKSMIDQSRLDGDLAVAAQAACANNAEVESAVRDGLSAGMGGVEVQGDVCSVIGSPDSLMNETALNAALTQQKGLEIPQL